LEDVAHIDLAMEGLELAMQESAVFRKTFCQLLTKMYIPYKSPKVSELRDFADGMLAEFGQTEILTSRVLEKFITQLDSLPENPSTVENVAEELSSMHIEK
jgi:hypothetical protein